MLSLNVPSGSRKGRFNISRVFRVSGVLGLRSFEKARATMVLVVVVVAVVESVGVV